MIITKSVTKSVTKLTEKEVDYMLVNNTVIQTIKYLLDYDLSDVRDYVRNQIVYKSVTKSMSKLIDIADFLSTERSRQEILVHIGKSNQSKNFTQYLLPLLEAGIIEMTIPDKPKSQHQKYRLTEKGKKLIKI